MKKKVRAEVFAGGIGNLTGGLAVVTKKFNEWLESVPEEYRSSVELEISCNDCGEYGFSTVEIYYYRDETDEEEAAREKKEARGRKYAEEEERRKYLELKRKFEGDNK